MTSLAAELRELPDSGWMPPRPVLRVVEDIPRTGTARMSPVVGDSASAMVLRGWMVQSLLLEAIAHEAAGDPTGARDAAPSSWPSTTTSSYPSSSTPCRPCSSATLDLAAPTRI
jgi:hypothetical protein